MNTIDFEKLRCQNCINWIDCSNEKEIKGFCLLRELSNHTALTFADVCCDYVAGVPMTLEEFSNWIPPICTKVQK